jgi:hypothetical protein
MPHTAAESLKAKLKSQRFSRFGETQSPTSPMLKQAKREYLGSGLERDSTQGAARV